MNDIATNDVLTGRLRHCYTGVVHDVLRSMGLRNFTLPPELRPILPQGKLAGPVFTVEGRVDPSADPHTTLVEWTGLLSKARPRHVWVSQPNDSCVATMGELSAETLKRKGVLGCVIDGGVRDVNFLHKLEFQTWARFFTPRDIVGYWLPKAVDEEIRIGDVQIAPGDFVFGDRDGMVRVPRHLVEEVIEEAEQSIAAENKVRTAILSGVDPQQAYLQYRKF